MLDIECVTEKEYVFTRGHSLSNYRSTFFRNAQALGDVKRLLPNAPAQYLTAVRILTLLVLAASHICVAGR